MDNLSLALAYLKRGVSVIPLWSPGQFKAGRPSWWNDTLSRIHDKEGLSEEEKQLQVKRDFERLCKTPIITWKEYQSRLPTEEEVVHWFGTEFPCANIGIVTGQASNLLVFDLDGPGAEEYAEERGGFPTTPTVRTGKGRHVYVRLPGMDMKNRVNKNLTIDIREEGGYVVAPPSVHGNGTIYAWEEGLSILDIDPAECSPWMREYLEASLNPPPVEKKTKVRQPGPDRERQAEKVKNIEGVDQRRQGRMDGESPLQEILRDGVVEGERNAKAAQILGSLLGRGNEPGMVWEIIKDWNKKNQPPLEEHELKRTFDSVYRMEQRKRAPKIVVSDLLDTPEKIMTEHEDSYLRVSFGGSSLPLLERQMSGGLAGGRLYLLGGMPSAGKTLLLNEIADNLCLNDHPVLFFSLDDGRSDLLHRTLARFSSHSIEAFNTNTVPMDEILKICDEENIKKITRLKYVQDRGITVEEWDDLIAEIDGDCNKKPVILIDYLRKLRSKRRTQDERIRVDNLVLHLTELAKKHNIPIVVISELARDSYKGGQRLSIASFKETGTIEYEASWLGILAPVRESDGTFIIAENWERIIKQEGTVDLVVFKAKRGTGQTGRIPLKLDTMKMTVRDRSRSQQHESNLDTQQPTQKRKKPSVFG